MHKWFAISTPRERTREIRQRRPQVSTNASATGAAVDAIAPLQQKSSMVAKESVDEPTVEAVCSQQLVSPNSETARVDETTVEVLSSLQLQAQH